MTPRVVFACLSMLSLTGCVAAAIPMAAQLASGASSTAQLCSMTKIPGQTTTLCDRLTTSIVAATQQPTTPVPPPPPKTARN